MKAYLVLPLALAACGRLGFDAIDPIDDASDMAPLDGVISDTSVPDRDGAPPIDTPPATQCSMGLPVTVGTRLAASTCELPDVIDGCGPPGTREVVFRFDPPTTDGYQTRAYNPGTNNVSNSTTRVTPDCLSHDGNCSGILGTTYQAGTTYYFVIEAAAGGCADIEFLITAG